MTAHAKQRCEMEEALREITSRLIIHTQTFDLPLSLVREHHTHYLPIKYLIRSSGNTFNKCNILTLFSFSQYIADNRVENDPWHGVDNWALKVVKLKLIPETLLCITI